MLAPRVQLALVEAVALCLVETAPALTSVRAEQVLVDEKVRAAL